MIPYFYVIVGVDDVITDTTGAFESRVERDSTVFAVNGTGAR